MPTVQLTNAYYRGWFAARAQRAAPKPMLVEELSFIDMGFADGKLSHGGPLKAWSNRMEAAMAIAPGNNFRRDSPVFSTRPGPEPTMPGRGHPQPAHQHPDADENRSAAQSAEPVTSGNVDTEEKKEVPRLPQKQPQMKMPGRPIYASGKRGATRFSR